MNSNIKEGPLFFLNFLYSPPPNATLTPGSGLPAAPVNSVQWNNAGLFGGSANFLWLNSIAQLDVKDTGGVQSFLVSPSTGIYQLGQLSPNFNALYIDTSGATSIWSVGASATAKWIDITHSTSIASFNNFSTINLNGSAYTLNGPSNAGANAAGFNFTVAGGKGTGTGVGGNLIFQVAKPGTAGSSANSLNNILVLTGNATQDVVFTSKNIILNPFATTAGGVGEIHFKELAANGNEYVALRAPDAIGASFNITLPVGGPAFAGYALVGDALANLSWASIVPQWSVSGSDIFYSAGKVGVGAAPNFLFHVLGSKVELQCDDVNQWFQFVTGSAAGIGINQVPTLNSPLAVGGLTAYANNAAALGAGLIAGEFYRISVAGTSTVAVVQ